MELKIDAVIDGDGYHMVDGNEMHRFAVTLICEDRCMTLPFHTGMGWDTEPTAKDVLTCVLSDITDETFEDWADDFGYDTDSSKAEATYRAVIEQTKAFRALVGPEAFEELRYGDLDDNAARIAGETR
jgi:hypothetical protein